jgi:ATP-binding cassette, subfamily B, bacterial
MTADRPPADPFGLPQWRVALVILLGLGQAATLIAFVLLVWVTADAIGADPLGAQADAAWRATLIQLSLLVGVAVLHGGLRAWEFSVSEKIGYEVVQRVRMQMYQHLQGMTPRQVQYRSRGGLILRFIGDLSMLRTWISRGLLGGAVAVIILLPAVVAMVVLNHRLGLVLVAVLATGAAVSLASGHAMRRATRTMRRRRSLLISNLDEQINALPVVQVFGRSWGECTRLSRQNDSLTRALFRTAELRGRLRGISSAVALLAVVAVLGVGLLEVRRGSATVGQVVAVLIMSRLLGTPVRTLGLAHDYWHRSQVSRQKVLEFLRSSSSKLDPAGHEQLRVRGGGIEFREVTVDGVLEKVTLTAQAGQLVAVTGTSGAGKSTLLALVARQVDPTGGEVVVDGQPLAATTPKSTFRKIGVMGPDLPLMRGTVRRNLAYSRPDADAAEIARVVYTSGLDRVLGDLPDGLATWVVEGGRNLSVGQRQRIALGRALLGNPPILLLDEPTANLDPAAKEEFCRMIARHQGTVLLATTDPAETAMADQVWVLDRGRVVEALSGEEYRDRMWLASHQVPAPARSAPAESAPAESGPTEPGPTESGPTEPTTVDSATVDSATVDSATVEGSPKVSSAEGGSWQPVSR